MFRVRLELKSQFGQFLALKLCPKASVSVSFRIQTGQKHLLPSTHVPLTSSFHSSTCQLFYPSAPEQQWFRIYQFLRTILVNFLLQPSTKGQTNLKPGKCTKKKTVTRSKCSRKKIRDVTYTCLSAKLWRDVTFLVIDLSYLQLFYVINGKALNTIKYFISARLQLILMMLSSYFVLIICEPGGPLSFFK